MNLQLLRKKFIIIAMSSVIGVLFALMAIINVINYDNVMKELDQRLDLIEFFDGNPKRDMGGPGAGLLGDGREKPGAEPKGQGTPPGEVTLSQGDRPKKAPRKKQFEGLNEDSPFDTRFFTASLKADGSIASVNMDNIASIEEDEALALAKEVCDAGRKTGMKEGFKYRLCEKSDGESYYIFLLTQREMGTFRRFLYASILVSALGVLLVFIPVFILSGRIVKPVAESYEKQKRFITDASHELKTPLAIIEADTEVIELTMEESEWTASIRHQIARLSSLIEKLVFLTRMDEESTRPQITRLNLSDLVEDVCRGFEAISLSSDKPLKLDLEPEIYYEGDEAMLRQMVSLLMDNAFKYGKEGEIVEVSLGARGHGRHHVRLTQKNTAEGISAGSQNMLFERFYRKDASRSSETGGSGIGLSVVEAIVRAHHGRISAECPRDGVIVFQVLL